MKDFSKQYIKYTLLLILGFSILLFVFATNHFMFYAGGISSNTFFMVTGYFAEMFPINFFTGSALIGIGFKGYYDLLFT